MRGVLAELVLLYARPGQADEIDRPLELRREVETQACESAPDLPVGALRVQVVVACRAQRLRDLAQDLVEIVGARVPLGLQRLKLSGRIAGPACNQRRQVGLEVAQLCGDL